MRCLPYNIAELPHLSGKNYLIDEMESTLNTFDVNNFNMEALHVEYEDVIATWLGLQNDLER